MLPLQKDRSIRKRVEERVSSPPPYGASSSSRKEALRASHCGGSSGSLLLTVSMMTYSKLSTTARGGGEGVRGQEKGWGGREEGWQSGVVVCNVWGRGSREGLGRVGKGVWQDMLM